MPYPARVARPSRQRLRPVLGAALVALLVGCGDERSGSEAPPRSLAPEAFTQVAVAAVRARHPRATIEVLGPLRVRVVEGDREGTLLLDNALRAHRAHGVQAQEALASLLAALAADLADAESPTLDPRRLVAIVRDEGYVAELRAHAQAARAAPSQVPFYEPLAADLVVLYAEDSEGRLSVLSPERLSQAGLSRDQAAQHARANLRTALASVRVHLVEGLHKVEWDGVYESSLLLLDELWTPERFPVPGDLVVAAPARHMVIVTGTGSPERVEKLRGLAERGVEELDHPVSARLLVRREGRWEEMR